MSGLSPVSVLFSSDGYELAAINGNAIPTNNRGILVEGSDGTDSRFITVDTSGRVVLVGAGTAGSGAGGVLTIQGNASGTPVPVSGTVTAANASVSTTGAAVPGSATFVGGEVQALQSGLTTGDLYPLSMTTAGLLRVDGSNVTQPVSGTVTANAGTGSFTVAQATASNLNATVVGSGNFTVVQTTASNLNATVTANGNFNNASVSATAAAAPASITYVGGLVTTSAESGLTNNDIYSLSLTTAGLLRIDGVYPVNATTPTSDAVFVAGAVTTSAPSYTTGQMSALSLDTSGNLRVAAITDKSSTGTITSVAISTSSVTLLSANSARISATFVNDSLASTLYIALSATATTSAYTTKLLAGDYWELPLSYTGAVSAISNISQGNVRVTELT